MGDLKAHFRPEFLNRLDEIIMFKPLTKTTCTFTSLTFWLLM